MGSPSTKLTTLVSSSLILSLLALAGCNKPADAPQKDTAATAAAPQPAPYQPPTAEQLSQMVAPIALFPDKLVGQVLAGATYPEQITAADQWLTQNPSLKGAALQNAESGQPWDVSVKSLTTFPSVLDQMANNIQWTTSLGQAYVNDPNDVMNAIQVLRLRAQQSGNLKTSQHLRVVSTARPAVPETPDNYVRAPDEPLVYSGPPVIHAPPQTIVIESAEPDVVYVPHYNPAVVYGAPVPVYPGWVYREPSGYSTETLVTTGALSFGVGILVGAAVSHHDGWGWNSWGVNWGGPAPYGGYGGGWHRPAVVYNNSTYVSKSVTVINQVNNSRVTNVVNNNNSNNNYGNNYRTNNINNVRNVNNVNNSVNNNVNSNNVNNLHNNNLRTVNNNFGQNPANNAVLPQQRGMMSMPHFTSHDAVPGARAPLAAAAMHTQPSPQMQQFAPTAHNVANAPNAPVMPHDAHQPQRLESGAQAGRTPALEANAMQREQREQHHDHLAAQSAVHPASMPPAAAPAPSASPSFVDRGHAEAMREHDRQQQERNMAAAGAPPARQFAPAAPAAPLAHHDSGLDRAQAHAVRADVMAVHAEHVQQFQHAQQAQRAQQAQHAQQAQMHAEKHAESGHHPDKNGKHEAEHHG